MRHLLDTHSLSNKLMDSSTKRDDLYVLEDVMDEYAFSNTEAQKVTRAGIKILGLEKKHLEKMKEIMAAHGDNLKLIRLYTSKGVGDVAMLAYILAEKATTDTLFPETYTIVTQDKELCRIAATYSVACLETL
jgi:hypothetical protein